MAQWRLLKLPLEKSLEWGYVRKEDNLRIHILEHLTNKMRGQVLKHDLKWRHQKLSVKVFVPPTLDWDHLKALFEQELDTTYDFETENLAHTRQFSCSDCSSE